MDQYSRKNGKVINALTREHTRDLGVYMMLQSKPWKNSCMDCSFNTRMVHVCLTLKERKQVMKSRIDATPSLLADQTTISHSAFCKRFLFSALKSDLTSSNPHPLPSCLSRLQLTVKRVVISNGNDTPRVKVTLCQNFILWFLPA